ncbi:hypothetical protein BCF33_0574 [Hasllibacter halocynthiae]|uniref:Uncharacterized protein n=1 Tax=Hasllibacter halocynthiae TaxID=595589 RepID=A0A2T0X7R0_9RHOB|nr:hypothetical protein BCF33_0574 [Hasllibacter halocynthiae]
MVDVRPAIRRGLLDHWPSLGQPARRHKGPTRDRAHPVPRRDRLGRGAPRPAGPRGGRNRLRGGRCGRSRGRPPGAAAAGRGAPRPRAHGHRERDARRRRARAQQRRLAPLRRGGELLRGGGAGGVRVAGLALDRRATLPEGRGGRAPDGGRRARVERHEGRHRAAAGAEGAPRLAPAQGGRSRPRGPARRQERVARPLDGPPPPGGPEIREPERLARPLRPVRARADGLAGVPRAGVPRRRGGPVHAPGGRRIPPHAGHVAADPGDGVFERHETWPEEARRG